MIVLLIIGILPKVAQVKVDVSSIENIRTALPKIPDRTFTLTDFGAAGDGQTIAVSQRKRRIRREFQTTSHSENVFRISMTSLQELMQRRITSTTTAPTSKATRLKSPESRNLLVNHATIPASRSAGKFAGIPDRFLRGITLEDVTHGRN